MNQELAEYFEIIRLRFERIQEILTDIGSDPGILNWKPRTIDQPSIYATGAYIPLFADFWIGHVLGGRAEPPGFDSVLDEAAGENSQLILQLLSSALETIRLVFEDMDEEKLNSMLQYADDIFKPRQCILQVVDEIAERCGEIEVLKRWFESLD
jgi:hypothetical protein